MKNLDAPLTMDGSRLAIATPAFDLEVELVDAEGRLDRIGGLAAGSLRDLVVLTGSAIAALPEAPRSLCLADVLEQAAKDLADAAGMPRPPGEHELSEALGTLVVMDNRLLVMSGPRFDLRIKLSALGTPLDSLDPHQYSHLQQAVGLYGWLMASAVEQPSMMGHLEILVQAVDKMVQLNIVVAMHDRGMIDDAGLVASFAAYAFAPIAIEDMLGGEGE